ncbi:MAG: hypothetical protein LBE17_06605 [Treponema sp.]|nr:hypothetical protein [Treponema sp.]
MAAYRRFLLSHWKNFCKTRLYRDYFANAPVRILVFGNRIEIISPRKLPNSLTVEEINYGNPVIRNNQITSFASKLLPYSGLVQGYAGL